MPEGLAKRCFVIAPIGAEDSETRRRSDKMFKHIIAPVTSAHGYHAERADHMSKPGLITTQVIARISGDELVIADLTEHNANVFYELAVRHALGRPFVQLIEKGTVIPFDVAAMRTIEVDLTDLDDVETAKVEMDRQIDELERDPTSVETPLSFAMELSVLRESGDPRERSLADVLDSLSQLRTEMRDGIQQILRGIPLVTPDRTGVADASEREWWRLRRDMTVESQLTRRALATDPQLRALIDRLSDRKRAVLLTLVDGLRLEEAHERAALRDVLFALIDAPASDPDEPDLGGA
jgi:hypothetical protein